MSTSLPSGINFSPRVKFSILRHKCAPENRHWRGSVGKRISWVCTSVGYMLGLVCSVWLKHACHTAIDFARFVILVFKNWKGSHVFPQDVTLSFQFKMLIRRFSLGIIQFQLGKFNLSRTKDTTEGLLPVNLFHFRHFHFVQTALKTIATNASLCSTLIQPNSCGSSLSNFKSLNLERRFVQNLSDSSQSR